MPFSSIPVHVLLQQSYSIQSCMYDGEHTLVKFIPDGSFDITIHRITTKDLLSVNSCTQTASSSARLSAAAILLCSLSIFLINSLSGASSLLGIGTLVMGLVSCLLSQSVMSFLSYVRPSAAFTGSFKMSCISKTAMRYFCLVMTAIRS